MNEYDYGYLGTPRMVPNSVLNFMNGFPQNSMINNDSSYMQNMYDKTSILDPTNGFIKGNMFDDLYDPYKKYKPTNLDPKDEKEALLMSFMQYNFVLKDLGLYLDVYPNDNKVINLYKQYLNIYDDIKNKYEKKYGPLTCNSIYSTNGDWKWDNSPWPWEVM